FSSCGFSAEHSGTRESEMIGALVDNDVVIKVAAYGLQEPAVWTLTLANTPPSMLNVGRYVARDAIGRVSRVKDTARARTNLEAILGTFVALEPTNEEISPAAVFESVANTRGLSLDVGESKLPEIMLSRGGRLLQTGEKRATTALGQIAA